MYKNMETIDDSLKENIFNLLLFQMSHRKDRLRKYEHFRVITKSLKH